MDDQFFILEDKAYRFWLCLKKPRYNKRDSWFLLTDGITDDIIVDDHTTVKQVWEGRYKRFVEISRTPILYMYTFDSMCKETAHSFKVTIKAFVSVEDPKSFYRNHRHFTIDNFFINHFSMEVGKVTREYSLFKYHVIDDALTEALSFTKVVDATSGLACQIANFDTRLSDPALQIVKKGEDTEIETHLSIQEIDARHRVAEIAREAAQKSTGKTYEEAVWEEVILGIITPTIGVQKIDDYDERSFRRLFEISPSDIKSLHNGDDYSNSADEFFESAE